MYRMSKNAYRRVEGVKFSAAYPFVASTKNKVSNNSNFSRGFHAE